MIATVSAMFFILVMPDGKGFVKPPDIVENCNDFASRLEIEEAFVAGIPDFAGGKVYGFCETVVVPK